MDAFWYAVVGVVVSEFLNESIKQRSDEDISWVLKLWLVVVWPVALGKALSVAVLQHDRRLERIAELLKRKDGGEVSDERG